jgi:hypothetical protein
MMEAFCRTLNNVNFAEKCLIPGLGYLSRKECIEVLWFIIDPAHIETSLSYQPFLQSFSHHCLGRSLFITEEGYIGISTQVAKLGDSIVVVPGINECAMVLRQTENGQHKVLGEAYCEGFMEGEALLGPLPDDVELVKDVDASPHVRYSFLDRKTGVVQLEDPRLGPLPLGWREEEHPLDHIFHWFVNETGENAGSRDPRTRSGALKERGVNVEIFNLI